MTRRGNSAARGLVAVIASFAAIVMATLISSPAESAATSERATSAKVVFPKWKAHRAIDAYGGVYSVSCASAQMCVALGNTSVAFKVQAPIWNGLRWKHGAQLPFYAIANVSCPTTTFCMAAGEGGDGTAHGAVVRWNGKKWSGLVNVTSTSGNYLKSVDCASPEFCVVGDSNGNVQMWDGHTWSEPISIDSPYVTTIECPSSKFCVAGDQFGRLFRYRNKVWNQLPDLKNPKPVSSISCVSPKFCAAVAKDSQGYASTWNGTKWSAMKHVDVNPLLSVTCPQKNYCVAVDSHGWDTVYNGKKWAPVHRISELQYLNSVSCPTKRFCMTTTAGAPSYAYWTPLPKPRIILTDNAPKIRHGDTLVFTVRLTGQGRTPTGTITWTLKGPGSPSCQPTKLKAGKAVCRIGHAKAGRYTATAFYSGDAWYRPVRAVDHATVR